MVRKTIGLIELFCPFDETRQSIGKRATEFSYEFLTQRTSTAGELAQILRREILKWRNGVAGGGIKVH